MTVDERALASWGETIGREVQPPLVLALRGPLGAGKSVLARAVGRGAGVVDAMPSPTYNLLFRYPVGTGHVVVHMDLYRLSAPDEVWELGWSELGAAGEIVLIEWPERAGELLPADRWDVTLVLSPGEPERRRVRLERHGNAPDLPPLPATAAVESSSVRAS